MKKLHIFSLPSTSIGAAPANHELASGQYANSSLPCKLTHNYIPRVPDGQEVTTVLCTAGRDSDIRSRTDAVDELCHLTPEEVDVGEFGQLGEPIVFCSRKGSCKLARHPLRPALTPFVSSLRQVHA